MKKSHITSFLIALSITINTGHAYEAPKVCTTTKVATGTDCVSCAQGFATKISEGPIVLGDDFSRSLQEFTVFDEKVNNVSQVHTSLKNNLAPLFRTLRDGQKEPSYKESMIEINSIKEDFDYLTVLSKESVVTQKKLDKCSGDCSPLQKTLESIQKARTAILIKRPILANHAFEEMMMNIPKSLIDQDQPFSNFEFEKTLMTALHSTIGVYLDKLNDIALFQYDGSRPVLRKGNEEYTSSYVESISDKFPELVADVLQNAEADGTFSKIKNSNNILCLYAKKFEAYTKKKARQQTAIDVGLFVLPMLAGPIGIEAAIVIRLATWGMKAKTAATALRAGAFAVQAGLLKKDYDDLKTLSAKCTGLQANFFGNASESKLKEFQDCQEEYGQQAFISELGVLATGTVGISKYAMKVLALNKARKASISVAREARSSNDIASYVNSNGLRELKPGQVGLEFSTPDQGTFSILSLNEVIKSGSDNVKKLPESYWRYVANIYSQRLNLTKEEIESFVKSSVEMSPRTKLIMNTDTSPLKGVLQIKGGVGIVDSKVASELLPLEKATGIRILRQPNEKIVEIVRLTVGKDGEATKLSSSLVDQALNLIQNDKDVNRVFIYTSKGHARLYKAFGVTTESIRPIDKRDVLIEISREHLKRVIDSKGPLTSAKVSGQFFLPFILDNYLTKV